MLRTAEKLGAFWGWVGLRGLRGRRGQRGASPELREKEAVTDSRFPIPVSGFNAEGQRSRVGRDAWELARCASSPGAARINHKTTEPQNNLTMQNMQIM